MSDPRDAVIISGSRTPFGRLKGQLADFTAVELGAAAIAGALDKAGVPAADVQAVIMGPVSYTHLTLPTILRV